MNGAPVVSFAKACRCCIGVVSTGTNLWQIEKAHPVKYEQQTLAYSRAKTYPQIHRLI